MVDNSAFAAAPSLAGYLYQARVALALCLRYAYVEGSVEVAVERLDDVSFERGGAAIELLQTKHRLSRRSDLSDASADLWKTLRIWSEQAKADPSLPGRTRLVLMTTGVVEDGTIAALLRPIEPGRVISGETAKEASERLTYVAETSANTSLKPAFDAYLALTPRMRASLISAVQVLDGQPMIMEVGDVIEQALRMAAPRGQAGRARELLEGWWWPRIVEALIQKPVEAVSILEIETKLDEIRESLQRFTLTTEFEDAALPDAELKAYDGHGFVRQLRAIGVGGNRIEHAKRDYYRAFSQRSHWARQHAVLDGEMARFEANLVEEWEPRFNAMCDRHEATDADDQALQESGQEIYRWVETEARFPFRSLVKRFLNVGSYHMLANARRVGWHRDFNKIGLGED